MAAKKESPRQRQGMATRRKVLGKAYVDASVVGRTEFNGPFLDLITESAWSHVWSRPNWTKRERSMVTLALLAALGHHEEFVLHLRATKNTGATMDDVREALLHVAIYAGVPAANTAMRIAKQTYAEMDAGKGRK
ncbi:MAG: 4-carboxymuconolactone decarboxylase [Rhizobiaceae bacterium]|nr:4-carboxymuconolactone decarboxylase [Rhizobiaceae bacterium]